MADRYLTDKLDLSTPERARKAMHDLKEAQRDLKRRNLSLHTNLEKKAADLRAIQ